MFLSTETEWWMFYVLWDGRYHSTGEPDGRQEIKWYLELCCNRIGQSLQRWQVKSALILAEFLPVLRDPDDLVDSLQYATATCLCPLQGLQVRGSRWMEINQSYSGSICICASNLTVPGNMFLKKRRVSLGHVYGYKHCVYVIIQCVWRCLSKQAILSQVCVRVSLSARLSQALSSVCVITLTNW